MLLVPSRETRESERVFAFADFSSYTPCVLNCAGIWLLSPCWNSWSALFVCCLSSAIFPLWYSLLSALSAKPALCLFVPGMSCLFWDIESQHSVRSTGCLPTLLAVILLSCYGCLRGRGFICKQIIVVASMVNHFTTDRLPSLYTIHLNYFL